MSQPLRALVLVIGGWTALRTLMVLNAATGLPARGAGMPLEGAARHRHAPVAILAVLAEAPRMGALAVRRLQPARTVPPGRSIASASARHASSLGTSFANPMAVSVASPSEAVVPDILSTIGQFAGVSLLERHPTRRLSGSAWALVRSGGGPAALGAGGTLGGSQAGMRLFYEPGPRRLALTARLSAPLAVRGGRDGSVGVALRGQLGGILLERRFAFDRGARDAMAVTAYGGVNDVALPGGFRLDGYAQAGIVGVRNPAAFTDGAVAVAYPVLRSGGARLSVGASLSGGAQPGAARLDVGPQVTADIPMGIAALHVAAGWRARVAGGAAPGNGPAVTVSAGF